MINKVEHRIVVLGPGGVGKSCLCIQFIQGHFVQTYDPTVEDSYRKQIELDGHPYMIELLDTAGQDQFASMREQYMKSGDAFVLVYSIADTETLNCVVEIYEQLIAVKGSRKITCILVGNKADLKGERQVQLAEGEALAARWGVLFCESSALFRKTPHKDTTPAHMHAMIGTEEVFMRVLRRLIHPEDLQQTRMGPLSGSPAVHPEALAASHSDSNMENVSELKTLTSNLMRGGNFPLLVTRKKRRLCSIL